MSLILYNFYLYKNQFYLICNNKLDLAKLLKTNNRYIAILNSSGIKTANDFFIYFPRNYEDRTSIKTLSQIYTDQTVQIVKGKIISKNIIKTPTGKTLIEIGFEDINGQKGYISYINSSLYTIKNINLNSWYNIIGKAKLERGRITFWHPQIVPITTEGIDHKIGRIYPIYTEIMGIKSEWFAKKIWENIDKISDLFIEELPEDFLKEFDLMGIKDCIKNIHYPENKDILEKAKYRIYFEKLLNIQLISALEKINYQKAIINKNNLGLQNRNIIKDFIENLPFTLTKAQKKVIKEIVDDFHKQIPMLRLLQGDVGSGKTIVSIIVSYYIIKFLSNIEKAQVAVLAPTEVLANQLFQNYAKWLLNKGLKIEYLSGSLTAKQKQKIKQSLENGNIDIVVGTHALIQEDINFKNLKFVIIDEQHKFGVLQRAFFKKFQNPHILQMSATPIPRSLTLAFFGEFDISVIDELPVGRKPVYTKIIDSNEFIKLKQWIVTKISNGQQVFIVTPLIQESEKLDELKSAIGEYEQIKNLYDNELKKIFGNLNDCYIGLLHGKLSSKEKDKVMQDFKTGKYKILVSTTVIEVGVDIPNATIMIIKNAERFGLSQLHQLRGRVGRSSLTSYCFLETEKKYSESYKRLKVMEKTYDGFKLAEIDLQIRGGGEILGTRQSGESQIPIEILTNIQFLEKVQKASKWLLEKYPNLNGLKLLYDKLKKQSENLLA